MTTESQESKTARLFTLDALRGLIMVFMALDHANHFVAHRHSAAEIWDGVFPVYQNVLPFVTRWVTHLAAPGFFLLMGAGMTLFARTRQERCWSRRSVIRHFLIRGMALMALQLLVVNRAWELSPGGWGVSAYIGVLFALGGTMLLGSLLLWLRPAHLAAFSLALFVGVEVTHPGLGMWGTVSHAPLSVIFLHPGGTGAVWAYYSILPWLELVTFGVLIGQWLSRDPRHAFNRAWKLGLVFLSAFVVIRFLDGFGNIRPRMSDSWIDFLNPVKYPPSMAFTLMTTGVNLILLWGFSRAGEFMQRILRPLTVFGRTPLFFYLLHLFLYAGIGYVLAPAGTSIGMLYPFWLFGLLILFPLCLAYGRWKGWQPANSLVRFL